MRPDTLAWWRQAEADLHSGDIMLANGQWYAASWFAQQATEKALKALFIERTTDLAPRTHDLEYLGTLVGAPASVDADLQILNPTFDESRYPDNYGVPPVDAVSSTEATMHIEACRRVLGWVLPLL
ncbi:MAG: HEPN domain-containing protein [Chloroflexi bacterium]|nr:HEPN domain-containing protein [Chloroflexota bacterium]